MGLTSSYSSFQFPYQLPSFHWVVNLAVVCNKIENLRVKLNFYQLISYLRDGGPTLTSPLSYLLGDLRVEFVKMKKMM